MTRIKRTLALLTYYLLAQRLPDWSFPGGPVYRFVRGKLSRGFIAHSGHHVNIESRVYLADGRWVWLGDGSSIGQGSRVYGARIGDGVMIAPGCVLHKDNHVFDDLERPIGVQGRTEPEPPTIRDWAWIGERSVILPGVVIGKGAIVGTGSVVTRDVPDFEIHAGNPAKRIGTRARAASTP